MEAQVSEVNRAPEQAARRNAHYAKKVRKTRTPLQKTAVAWDQWRHLITRLPADMEDQLADAMTAAIKAEIQKLKPREGGDPQ
jgi:formate dehydrogenase maturation protein FdhE